MNMLEKYTSFIENDVQEIQILLAEENYPEIYRRYAPVLEDMLLIRTEAEWLDYMEQQGPELEERPLRLHLAAWAGCCLEIGCFEGDVTKKLMDFLRQDLPEQVLNRLKHPPVNVDIDESNGVLETQIKPYQEQLEPWGCQLKVFFDDTYCTGVYFVFLDAPQQW